MQKIYTALLCLSLFTGIGLQAQKIDQSKVIALVKKNAAQLQLTTADAENFIISSAYTDGKTNISYAYLQQTYQGIKVFNSIKTVIFRDNDVLYSSGNFVPMLEQKAGSPSPSISADIAVSKAATSLGLAFPVTLRQVEDKLSLEKKVIFNSGGISKGNIETELFWVTSDDDLTVKLAWNVNIDVLGSPDWWNVRIDAATGNMIEKNNWTVHEGQIKSNSGSIATTPFFLRKPVVDKTKEVNLDEFLQKQFNPAPPNVTDADYFVSTLPNESPRHSPMVLSHNPWLRAGAGNNAITNGWHFDGTTNFTVTRGNNVHAYLDVANSNNPTSPANTPVNSTTSVPALTFDFHPDYTQQPSLTVNRQAAVTNLFYWNNTIHDVLYQYGLNEVSGNFQTDNMGRGGNGNDYVQAEAQDGGGTNNANFGTPADGQRPRMQMFLWSGVPNFTVNSPGAVAGSYFATESGFSTNNQLINVGPRTGQVIYFNDDVAGTTHQACLTPANVLTGKIAMIDRGVCGFTVKVKAAQDAGAIAVIMVNNVAGFPITMGGTDNTITIPAVMISQADGALIAAQLANNVNVTLAAGVNIDGDFDNGVIVHEYGHGVSNRLTGGPANANCLANLEQGGEGWSDFLALMLTTNWSTAQVTDGNLPRPMGVYAVGQPLNGTGIRAYPYTLNMTVNPHTYADVATSGGEEHAMGEVWASALWDMAWLIIQQEGTITPDIYNASGTGGNIMALKLVMEGMRIQTCRPGFLDGRNAILAADSIMYGGRHRCAIWAAFARRGMGYSAVQGSSNSATDQVVAFDVPSSVTLAKNAVPKTAVLGEMVNIGLTATCDCQTNTNFVLRDTIPTGFTYVSSSGGTLSGNVVTFSGLNFNAAQETKTFTITIQPNVAGCALTNAINDNRDGSTTGGLTSVIATGAVNWVTSTVRSSSPTTSWFAAATTGAKDFSLTLPSANAFVAGNLSILSFKHYFVTENLIDGGRIEYSTNDGGTWLDAGPFMIQNGYNNTTNATSPWGNNQKMFGGVSYGQGSGQFITTLVNLSSLAGQSVRVRFRQRTNANNASNSTYEGWFVDDILQMDGCGGIIKAGLYNSTGTRVDSLASPVFIKSGTPVTITTQPSNVGLCVGGNASFTVVANAATSPTYQWQLSTDGGATFNDIPGATSATLTINGVTFAMNGYKYRVAVSSSQSTGFIYSNVVTLTVNTPATVTCPANITVSNTPGLCGANVTYPAAITTGSPAPTVTYSIPSGSFFPKGTTTVFVTSTNVCAIANCSFTVTVNDTQAPTITCPANITVGNATGQCGANVTFTVNASDNCPFPGSTPLTVTQSSSQSLVVGSVACNAGGLHTDNSYWRAIPLAPLALAGPFQVNQVSFGVEQAIGASGTQPVIVRIYSQPTGTFPTAARTLLGQQTFNVPNMNSAIFTGTFTTPPLVPPTTTMIMEIFTPNGQAVGNSFFIGSNAAAETGPSYISAADCGAPNPVTLASLGFPNMHVVMNAIGIVSNPQTSIVTTPASGSFFPVGTTNVTSTVTDASGNTATCTFTVRVNDTQAPTITCPGNITATTPVGSCTAVVPYTVTSSDNCPGVTQALQSGLASNAVYPIGVTTNTWRATDAAGNISTCTFTVTVRDGQLPVITGQPINITSCIGSNIAFAVTSTNAVTYQWQQWNGTAWVNIAGATASTLPINALTLAMNTNTYRVNVIGLCTTVTSSAASLYVNALPTITLTTTKATLTPGETTSITAVVKPTGGTIVWRYNGNVIPGGFTLSGLGIDDIGTYSATYTDLNGCVKTSNDLVITGLSTNNLYVMPNPNDGRFQVRFYATSTTAPMTLTVYSSNGSKVYQQKMTSAVPYSAVDVDLGQAAGGTYVVEIHDTDGKKIAARKIVVRAR